MSNSIIRAELETRLKLWADTQNPKVQVAFQNVTFIKPSAGPFLEPLLIPNVTTDSTLSGDRQTMLGIFEVRCWCQSGEGMGDVEALVNDIINLFPLIPKTGVVSIERTPYTERPMFDDSGWIIVPVMIFYRYEKQ